MSERAPYSRVYWAIVDDLKFATVYDDDRALALWLRLLLVADQAWPASASLPITTRKAPLQVLVDAGLVDPQTGGRYRVHGLDAERGRRRAAATRPDPVPDPTGTQQGPNRDPDVPSRGRAPRLVSSSSGSSRPAREGIDGIPDEVLDAWSEATGRSILGSGAFAQGYLEDACQRHGAEAVVEGIRRAREHFEHIPATQPLAGQLQRILDPFLNSKDTQRAEAEKREGIRSRKAVESTIRKAHETGFHEKEPDPRCSLCPKGGHDEQG